MRTAADPDATSGERLDTARLERTLHAHPSVFDCAVVERTTVRGERELIAYVVAQSATTIDELRNHETYGLHALPIVAVSTIPRDGEGRIDVTGLSHLPFNDAAVLAGWELNAASLSCIDRAAIVVDHGTAPELPLHLSDLLPDAIRRPTRHAGPGGPAHGTRRGCAPSPTGRLAVADGGDVDQGQGTPVVLGAVLIRAAATSRQPLVYIEPDGSATSQPYRSLFQGAGRILGGLQAAGVRPSDRVVLQLERHQDFFETFWACVLGGFVPVPVAVPPGYDKSSGPLETLRGAWNLLGPSHIVAVRRVVSELAAAATRLQLDGAITHAVEDLRAAQPGRRHDRAPDDLALLMPTSGSTGAPKLVMLTHRNLLSRTIASCQLNGFSSRDVTVNWMPLDHVAGLIYFHIRDVYLGCKQVHVPTAAILQEPLTWLDYLDRHRATITFAPNFAFALVNDHADEIARRSWDLSSLRFVLNGAEAIVARTARTFLTLLGRHGLNPTCMHPAWGMSETSSGVVYGDRFSLVTTADEDPFVEVGRPIPGLSMRIVDAQNRVLEEGIVGRFQVRGAAVTGGYYGSSELTRESFTEDGWFNTGDLGILQDGRLTITGREKDVVVVNSVNYYCHAIESVVEGVDGVDTSLTAACAVRPAGADTDRLAVFFHASDSRQLPALIPRIRTEVSTKVGIAPDYVLPVDAATIPKSSLGKILRSELSRRFVAGEFDDVVRHVDRLTASADTIPDWFYRRVWRRKEAAADDSLDARAVALIFLDRVGVGDELKQRLRQRGVRCITVRAGSGFAAESADSFRIDARAEGDYRRLVDAMADGGLAPTHIVHLWGYGPYNGASVGDAIDAAQFEQALSVLWLAQGLVSRGAPVSQICLTVVASHSQCVRRGEPVAYEKAPALGYVKSVPQEVPWLRCRHLDLFDHDPAAAAQLILREIGRGRSDREVAYRNGCRFVAGLEKAVFTPQLRADPLFKQGGRYLITGGVGGIGEQISRHLLDRFAANLLLIGRGKAEGPRADLLRRLCQDDRRVVYQQVDVCDESAMTRVVREYTSAYGALDGIVHLAGSYYESIAVDDTADRFAAMFAAKGRGTDVLHRLLEAQGGGLFVSASSIAAFFGGASIGAYAAASSFQEAFAEHFGERGPVKHYCFSWSNWDDIGQSRRYQLKDAARARGYRPIPAAQALQSLLICLSFRESGLLIGLDGAHRNIRRYLAEAPEVLGRPILYFTSPVPHAAQTALAALDIRDRFGTPSRPELIRISHMPTTSEGDIDVGQLENLTRGRENSATLRPRTEAERRVAEIWCRVLGVASVSVDDNFFDLGGDSLLAARLTGEIRTAFAREVSLRGVFDAPTLADLAELIGKSASIAVATPSMTARPTVDLHDVLARLNDLGEADVDALLDRFLSRAEEK